MNGTAELDQHQIQILKSASAVRGIVWVRTVLITRAEDMVRLGYLTRRSRSEFVLTEKGFNAIGSKHSDPHVTDLKGCVCVCDECCNDDSCICPDCSCNTIGRDQD